jgi:hypothetical protein
VCDSIRSFVAGSRLLPESQEGALDRGSGLPTARGPRPNFGLVKAPRQDGVRRPQRNAEQPGDVNYLHSGIWEFKHADRRLTFWDTDGEGNFTPKPKHHDPAERAWDPPEDGYWWYPYMDAVLRLGCAWPKTEQAAPQHLIEQACEIREEDCARDQREKAAHQTP